MQHRASLNFVIPAFLALLGGCIIIPNDNVTGGTGGSGAFTSSSSSSSSGEGGLGGQGGQGGQGGEAGGMGVGGGSNCVDDADGMKDGLACNTLNTQQVKCGPNMDQPPLANGVCSRGFKIYQGGAFDVLQSCLQLIEATDACIEDPAKDPVTACITEMYAAACPSMDSAFTCESIAKDLCINNEIFDTQRCLEETNPFNKDALQQLLDGITNSLLVDCNDAYVESFTKVISIP